MLSDVYPTPPNLSTLEGHIFVAIFGRMLGNNPPLPRPPLPCTPLQVKTRLPEDLTPAVCGADHTNASDENGRGHPGQRRGQQSALSTSTDSSNSTDRTRVKAKRQRLEGYRRDMLRAALGATLAEAGCLGAERGAPGARVVGTDEDNARRVATLAADEAIKELDARTEAAGRGWVHGSRTRYHVPSGPAGGARAQQRAALERAK